MDTHINIRSFRVAALSVWGLSRVKNIYRGKGRVRF